MITVEVNLKLLYLKTVLGSRMSKYAYLFYLSTYEGLDVRLSNPVIYIHTNKNLVSQSKHIVCELKAITVKNSKCYITLRHLPDYSGRVDLKIINDLGHLKLAKVDIPDEEYEALKVHFAFLSQKSLFVLEDKWGTMSI